MTWWLFGWSFEVRRGIPIRDYVDTRLADQRVTLRLVHEEDLRRFHSLEVTQEKLIDTMGRRIDSVDSRLQGVEQSKLGMDAHGMLERRVETAERTLANIQGRLWAITVGLTALTIATDIALRLLGH